MRYPRVQDYIRGLSYYPDKWKFALKQIKFLDVPTLGSGQIDVSSPITILAGPNGVGKTTLLKAIFATAVSGGIELDRANSLKLSAGKVSLKLMLDDDEFEKVATFTIGKIDVSGKPDLDVIYLEAASEVLENQKFFCAFNDIEDLINGASFWVLDENKIAEINYITCRQYNEIKIYEVEAESKTIPFFEVSYRDGNYDSRTMGMGELAALHLWWAVDSSNKNSLFLIEEPETYLYQIPETLTLFFDRSPIPKSLGF